MTFLKKLWESKPKSKKEPEPKPDWVLELEKKYGVAGERYHALLPFRPLLDDVYLFNIGDDLTITGINGKVFSFSVANLLINICRDIEPCVYGDPNPQLKSLWRHDKIINVVLAGEHKTYHLCLSNTRSALTTNAQNEIESFELYHKDGKLHREDGPAIILNKCDDGYGSSLKKWYRDGKLHREDGPAILSVSTDLNEKEVREYYKDGIKYADQTFTKPLSIEAIWNQLQ